MDAAGETDCQADRKLQRDLRHGITLVTPTNGVYRRREIIVGTADRSFADRSRGFAGDYGFS